jgi:hypothetical protein
MIGLVYGLMLGLANDGVSFAVVVIAHGLEAEPGIKGHGRLNNERRRALATRRSLHLCRQPPADAAALCCHEHRVNYSSVWTVLPTIRCPDVATKTVPFPIIASPAAGLRICARRSMTSRG